MVGDRSPGPFNLSSLSSGLGGLSGNSGSRFNAPSSEEVPFLVRDKCGGVGEDFRDGVGIGVCVSSLGCCRSKYFNDVSLRSAEPGRKFTTCRDKANCRENNTTTKKRYGTMLQ